MKKFIAILLAVFIFQFLTAQYQYPATKTVDSSDTWFGVTYKNPYRWLENFKDPAVVGWFKDQADFSDSVLNKLSGRDESIVHASQFDEESGRHFVQMYLPNRTVMVLEKVGE